MDVKSKRHSRANAILATFAYFLICLSMVLVIVSWFPEPYRVHEVTSFKIVEAIAISVGATVITVFLGFVNSFLAKHAGRAN